MSSSNKNKLANLNQMDNIMSHPRYYRNKMRIVPKMASLAAMIFALTFLSLVVQQANGIGLETWKQKYEGETANEYFFVNKLDGNPTKHTGYTGRGYADFGGKGSFVLWDIETTLERADYKISLRYSAPNQRSCYLYVDNTKQGEYSIDSTGSWNEWKDSNSITVSLAKGIHQIKVVAVGEAGPNVDFMTIQSSKEITFEQPVIIKDRIITAKEDERRLGPILEKDSSLGRGQFISSPNGSYKMGLVDSTGELVIMYSNSIITWSNGVVGGERVYMQSDGNLVVRNIGSKAVWNTESGGNEDAQLQLEIDKNGVASIASGSFKIWTTREPISINYNNADSSSNGNNNGNTNENRTFSNSNPNFKRFAERVVLNALENLPRGKFVSSPSNNYHIGLNDAGDFVLQDSSDKMTIWNANVKGCATATMQPDGNFVLRDNANKLIWTTHTSNNPGARLVVDDGGRLSVMVGKTAIWMEGIPRGVYDGRPSSVSLQFPLRGMFYYPWYPETWSVNSKPVKFVPDLGKYSSDDADIVADHVDAMEYAYSDMAIASWWGPGTSQELSRISLLMDKTFEMKSSIKWTIYYEDEMFRNPSTEKIRSDLEYLQKWFVWHPTWAFIEEKPVIYVYNEAGCDANERWMNAAVDGWYVVLKIFPGWDKCAFQPDSYHQYGPSSEYIHVKGVSSGVSPGFWRADMDEPKLPRLSKKRFCENTKKMVESGENWQLVTTFNEAGEGTLVEASSENWGSDTKYGYYLDCLHKHH
mmetsp:Transcript_24680/g.50993  ORF Transcript_24680/g.50993 Transcript_24680/m.50993 type:complete len:757 (+) Transcript_24680:119-2389(+)